MPGVDQARIERRTEPSDFQSFFRRTWGMPYVAIPPQRCTVCGVKFFASPRAPRAYYCSAQCRKANAKSTPRTQRPTFTRNCVICGTEFTTKHRSKAACSLPCKKQFAIRRSAEWMAANPERRKRNARTWARENLKQLNPAQHEEYLVKRRADRARRTAERAALGIKPKSQAKPKTPHACIVCDAVFTPEWPTRKFCSDQCARVKHSKGECARKQRMTLEQRRRPYWKQREAILKARPPKPCARCSKAFVPLYSHASLCSEECRRLDRKDRARASDHAKRRDDSPKVRIRGPNHVVACHCSICGGEFSARRTDAHICSKTCRARYGVITARAWNAENPERSAFNHWVSSARARQRALARDPEGFRARHRQKQRERKARMTLEETIAARIAQSAKSSEYYHKNKHEPALKQRRAAESARTRKKHHDKLREQGKQRYRDERAALDVWAALFGPTPRDHKTAKLCLAALKEAEIEI